MDLGAGDAVDLVGPIDVFPVIFGGEGALIGERSAPGAFVPGAAFDGLGGLPNFVEWVAEVEVDDGDAVADEGGELLEGDDVGI